MTVRGALQAVAVTVPAKMNLHLAVLGTRPDGYHDIETVFQSVAITDEVTCVPRPGPLTIRCDMPGIPLDDRNLAWRAARGLGALVGRSGEEGFALRIAKRIPQQAGLGGGSADAAATLIALARLWGLEDVPGGLEAVGAAIGADVPFLLSGGTALGTARGDRVAPLPDLPPREVVLIVPSFGIATAEAYGWLDVARSAGEAIGPGMRVSRWPAHAEEWIDRLPELRNDLEATVAARYPVIDEIRQALLAAGAEVAAMTGTGSAIFGLFRRAEAASAAAARCRARGWTLVRTRTLDRRRAALLMAPRFLPLSEAIG